MSGGDFRRLPEIPGRDPEQIGDEELEFHLEMRTREYMVRGMSESEARAAAEARLGDLDAVRRELGEAVKAEARSVHRREWFSDLWQDLRFGARGLLRTPGFTGVSVTTLAVGIGATTAIFSLVWAVLLAPLPWPDGDRLARVWETSPQGATTNVVSSGNVVDWRFRSRAFEVLAAHTAPFSVNLTGEGSAQRVTMAQVQPDLFRVLRTSSATGRLFTPRDAVDGGVVLLSHPRWEREYGLDPAVIGRTVTLDSNSLTIIGVLPERFEFPSEGVDFWTPLSDATLDPEERTSHNYSVVGRLAGGATRESAQREMSAIAEQIAAEYPAQMTGWGVNVVPLREDMTRDVAGLFWLLLGGVGVVLLIACGNLANLLLARAVARRREMAVRGALGAGRGRILRQLLTESSLLSGVGALGAMFLAPLMLGLFVRSAPDGIPSLQHAAVDLRMLAFAGATGIGCALLFGLAPALQLSKSGPGAALRSGQGASQRGHLRIRGILLGGQIALSVVLLIGAGLFVRSFRAIQSIDLGFEPSGLVMMDVMLPSPDYPEIPGQVAFYDELVERVQALPPVAGVATTSYAPGGGNAMTFSFAIEGRSATNVSGREDDELLHAVSPDYFRVTGRAMSQGRSFDDRDHADGVPVVILNESLARKHFPEGDAIGQRMSFRVDETPWREIVGVVADARITSPDEAPRPEIYIPFGQKTWPWLTWSTLIVRASRGTDPADLSTSLRDALAAIDRDVPPLSIRTVDSAFRRNTAPRTFAMNLVGGFGALAILLCVVGLYGLISYSVARERREFGVRIALGAASADVVQRVVGRSVRITAVGAAVGVGGAFALSRLIAGFLYGVEPTDPATYTTIVGLVLAVAVLTSLVPALRAGRIDPATALRTE